MPVTQDALYIPDDINTGLANGSYSREGSVIRIAKGPKKGQIVRFLKSLESIDLSKETQGSGFGLWAKQNIGRFLISSCPYWGPKVYKMIYKVIYKVYRKYTENTEPKVVTEFNNKLQVYLAAIQEGSMDLDKIDELINALEELKKHKFHKKINFQLTTEELEILVGCINEYTVKLAMDNNIELLVNELNIDEMNNSEPINNLQNNLITQKRIFEAVA